jgi:hypothetical protein
MNTKLLDQFDKELEVEYRGEMYRVRDNGSVRRQRRLNKRKRPLDGRWTSPGCTLTPAMSAIGPKRTSLVAPHMSAFEGKVDMPFCSAPIVVSAAPGKAP